MWYDGCMQPLFFGQTMILTLIRHIPLNCEEVWSRCCSSIYFLFLGSFRRPHMRSDGTVRRVAPSGVLRSGCGWGIGLLTRGASDNSRGVAVTSI